MAHVPMSPETRRDSRSRISLSPFPSPVPTTPATLKSCRPRLQSAIFASPVKTDHILSKDPVELLSNEEASDIFQALDKSGHSTCPPSPRFMVGLEGRSASPASLHSLRSCRSARLRAKSPFRRIRMPRSRPGSLSSSAPRRNPRAQEESDDDGEFIRTPSEDEFCFDPDDIEDYEDHSLTPTDLSFQFDTDNAQSRSSLWDNPLHGFDPARPFRRSETAPQFHKSIRSTSLGAFSLSTSMVQSDCFSLADINERINSPSMQCRTKSRLFLSPMTNCRHKSRVSDQTETRRVGKSLLENDQSLSNEGTGMHEKLAGGQKYGKEENGSMSVLPTPTSQASDKGRNTTEATMDIRKQAYRRNFKPTSFAKPKRRGFNDSLFPVRKYGSAASSIKYKKPKSVHRPSPEHDRSEKQVKHNHAPKTVGARKVNSANPTKSTINEMQHSQSRDTKVTSASTPKGSNILPTPVRRTSTRRRTS